METETRTHEYRFLAWAAFVLGIIGLITSLLNILAYVKPTGIYFSDHNIFVTAFFSVFTILTFYVTSGTSFILSLILLAKKHTRSGVAVAAFVLSILAFSWYGVAVLKNHINENCNVYGTDKAILCRSTSRSTREHVLDEYY